MLKRVLTGMPPPNNASFILTFSGQCLSNVSLRFLQAVSERLQII
jgi:hypothetical protein